MKRKINKNWYILYTNDLNEIHQEGDKPSYIHFNGYLSFCKNNKYHRKGNPTIIYSDGTLEYWEDNKLVKKIEI